MADLALTTCQRPMTTAQILAREGLQNTENFKERKLEHLRWEFIKEILWEKKKESKLSTKKKKGRKQVLDQEKKK